MASNNEPKYTMPASTAFDWLSDLTPAISAQESWHSGIYHADSLFHLVYQPDGPFAIACGAGLLAEHIRRFRFSPEIILRMGQITGDHGYSVFTESFLNYIQRLRLRVQMWAPPEGMLLLPGEPLAVLRGPFAQVQLMESALRWLVWRSTEWATQAARQRWENQQWTEEDTPSAPQTGFNFDGWKIRAEYIGGAFADDILDSIRTPSRPVNEQEGLICVWQDGKGTTDDHLPLKQIRRVYRGNHALGDIWLTAQQEETSSVSKTSAAIRDVRTHRHKTLKFTRFQNLYQPVLVKGHPVLSGQRLGYLRQRTLKQLEAFHFSPLSEYPHGWLE